MEGCCIFCKEDGRKKELRVAGTDRIQTIIKSSKQRSDHLHEDLETRLLADKHLNVLCHRDCVSTYTSKSHIKRHLNKLSLSKSSEEPSAAKHLRRSGSPYFSFRQHCLFCGEECLDIDPKHPDRWRRVVLCRTAVRGEERKTFKDTLLDVCRSRHDDWGREVELRLAGPVSDLHAADARYHADCYKKFCSPRSVKAASAAAGSSSQEEVDVAFETTVSAVRAESSRVWNSIELFNLYKTNGGRDITRRTLVSKLLEYFGSDLLVLSGTGVASLLVFRSKASSLLRLVPSGDDDDVEIGLEKVAHQILREVKESLVDDKNYHARVDMDIALDCASSTLLSLLSKLSKKLDHTLPAALIANIVTNVISGRFTPLQIALGVVLNRKGLIEQFYDFLVSCSYDEVLRFKTSAAAAAVNNASLRGHVHAEDGLVQFVSDNFDAQISSQNGLLSTHSLAMLLTFVDKHGKDEPNGQTFRRIRKEEMKQQVIEDIPVHRYYGPKKPDMPSSEVNRSVLPLRVLAHQVIALERAHHLDFEFFKCVAKSANPIEFGGFNTKLCREQGQSVKPATKSVYLPLIDMNPAHPDTMLTAMSEAQRLTKECGQAITILKNDQQLYRVAVNVKWVYPERFSDFIPRLGGMHMLMSFIGCVGVLMADSGLEDIMKSCFGGVAHMLSGKKFPQNFRALRLVTEELLRAHLKGCKSHEEMLGALENISLKSVTTRLWVQNLIKPVFIMMVFVRAEREGDWPLHLWAVKQMMPYFFASAHFNYARYGLHYLRTMERLPPEVLQSFMRGEHTMRHKPGRWNLIWSDMWIETTFMRYGHGPNGIIGITLKPDILKRWAYSMHTCSMIVQDVADMSVDSGEKEVTSHKEEKPSRITSDAKDRDKIRDKLLSCIDPLDPTDHPASLINVVTGRIAPETVNAHDAVDIGNGQLVSFEKSWPSGFNASLSKLVVTMAVKRKAVKVGNKNLYDTNLIYSRVLGLQQSRGIDIKTVLAPELSPVPTSMFDDEGKMRIATTKSTLKKKLQVTVSQRLVDEKSEVEILDGCAILWVISWPN